MGKLLNFLSKKRRTHAYLRDNKGQAVTEFAITLPVIILLIMGVLIIGLMIYTKLIVVLAASQGARVGGAIYNDSTMTIEEKHQQIEDTALTIVSNGLRGSERNVYIQRVGDDLVVRVTYEHNIMVPVISALFDNQTSITIEYTSFYRIL